MRGNGGRERHGGRDREGMRGKRRPEEIVFEGMRASAGVKAKRGKPGGRSSKRGTAFKAAGGKKNRDGEE